VTEPTPQPSESRPDDAPAERPARKLWQVGLRTMILLTAAIAVWVTYYSNRKHNAELEARIAVLRPMAHELAIDDPSRIAVVKLEELWYDENRWELFLPEGRYRLCLATREIGQNGLAPVVKSARLGPGRHSLALEQQREGPGWRVATWDKTGRLEVDEPTEWDPGAGSTGGGEYSVSTQLPADKPAVLFRRIFSRRDAKGVSTTPAVPAEGILLWIEPDSGAKDRR
jgi:hypothetical protein